MNSSVQQSELQSSSKTALDARFLLSQLSMGRSAVVDCVRNELGLREGFSKVDRDIVMYTGLKALVEQTIQLDRSRRTTDQDWEIFEKWHGALAAVLEVCGDVRAAASYPPLAEALKRVEDLKQLRRLEYYLTDICSSKSEDRAMRALAFCVLCETEGRVGSPISAAELEHPAVLPCTNLHDLAQELRAAFEQGKEQTLELFKFRISGELLALDKVDREVVLHFAFKDMIAAIEDAFVGQDPARFARTLQALRSAVGFLEALSSEGTVLEGLNTATPFCKALSAISQERHSELSGFRFAYQKLQSSRHRKFCRRMLSLALNNP